MLEPNTDSLGHRPAELGRLFNTMSLLCKPLALSSKRHPNPDRYLKEKEELLSQVLTHLTSNTPKRQKQLHQPTPTCNLYQEAMLFFTAYFIAF